MRIGHGYDVHRLTENRRLVLCGVDIPYEKGLLGHSDADVAVHAIMDALLGAAAMGDIGQLFPDTDPRFEGISSISLLEEVIRRITQSGYQISNIDCTIVALKPKLAPFIGQMRQNVASACKCGINQVSIKATTEEGLGLGEQAIGAHAVCLIQGTGDGFFAFAAI